MIRFAGFESIQVGDRLAWLWDLSLHSSLIAQVEDKWFDQFQQTFNHFVQSGQIWALFIGMILGYLIRSLTPY